MRAVRGRERAQDVERAPLPVRATRRAGTRSQVRGLVASAAVAILLAGCYGSGGPGIPSNVPGTSSQLIQAITRRGAQVVTTVSGDSACPDSTLVNNALHLRIALAADPTPRDVFVYTFRAKNWDASLGTVDACQRAFAGQHPGATVDRLDVPTYRTLGTGWSTDLRTILERALTETANAGAADQGG